ncbi:hypothetical protein GEOBRER4_n1299 [Citrifermentans bremense]|uniref:Uncharacterized protein n=1 Tax=Citrifermentans bremense TaxID=60035 RepID=A0A7R7IY68_9BACT|nr:hypothetical protein GEOBRER4_n1299 [Citrifermentans bremense]
MGKRDRKLFSLLQSERFKPIQEVETGISEQAIKYQAI